VALRLYLEAAGFETSTQSIGGANSYDNIHFALLGHGSIAAMASLEVQLSALDFAQLLTRFPV
jgi:hypothetical protein